MLFFNDVIENQFRLAKFPRTNRQDWWCQYQLFFLLSGGKGYCILRFSFLSKKTCVAGHCRAENMLANREITLSQQLRFITLFFSSWFIWNTWKEVSNDRRAIFARRSCGCIAVFKKRHPLQYFRERVLL